MIFDLQELKAAHRLSSAHRDQIMASVAAGCFSCLSTFPPSQITAWIEETRGELASRPDPWTARCPNCGIDAVIGSAAGYPVESAEFLTAMNDHWFGGEIDAQD